MPKAKRKSIHAEAQSKMAADPPRWQELRGWRAAAVLAVAVLFFYWIPLTNPQTSIQWDAVDVHYSPQKYFADRVLHGELPFWTPYIFSGFPFLADVQVGAWYPLNWPFFLAGVTPRAIQLEIAWHAFLACLGAFLLIVRFVPRRPAALLGSLAYAFSGYFADHSSHVGMFSAASLLPWLLLCFHTALERAALRFTACAGLVAGATILTGHFQTALYSFAALGLFAVAMVIEDRRKMPRAAAVLAGTLLLGIGLSGVQTLPGLELVKYSNRNSADFSETRDRILRPESILRVILPIGGQAFTQPDAKSGAPDSDFFLYGGMLLIPLAALGLRNRAVRLMSLLLIVPPAWYMLGPDAGLYRLGAILPGFQRVRAPIHFWFVTALGLAILMAAGAAWIFERWPQPAIPWAILAVLAADLFYWNSFTNVRAYARNSFEDLYGSKEELARQKVMPGMPPLTRFDAPDLLTVFGPLNHPLDLQMEATYGYNPLELLAYTQYRDASKRNPKLASGLDVARFLDVKDAAVRPNADALPRAYFARRILAAKDDGESLRLLESLDPAQATVVLGLDRGVQADPRGVVTVSEDGEQAYRLHYRTATPALLKLSVPYFPGWSATVDGASCAIVRADHALMGIAVPAGEKDLVVRFHSGYFGWGSALTALTAAIAGAMLLSKHPLLRI